MISTEPVVVELEAKSTSLTVRAKELPAIRDANQYRDAVDLGRSLKAMQDGIEEYWQVLISDAFRQHKALVARKNAMVEPVLTAMGLVKSAIGTYDAEQERIRREAERAAQAELKRQQDEAAIREAEQLIASGDQMGADQVIDQAVAAPAPTVIVRSNVPVVAGKSSRSVWKWRLKDASRLRPQYLIPDEQAISQVVRALKKNAVAAIGEGSIEVYEDKSVSFRG